MNNNKISFLINDKPASMFASLLIKNENFQRYMGAECEPSCDYRLKNFLSINSKAEIANTLTVYEKFQRLMRDYRNWVYDQGLGDF